MECCWWEQPPDAGIEIVVRGPAPAAHIYSSTACKCPQCRTRYACIDVRETTWARWRTQGRTWLSKEASFARGATTKLATARRSRRQRGCQRHRSPSKQRQTLRAWHIGAPQQRLRRLLRVALLVCLVRAGTPASATAPLMMRSASGNVRLGVQVLSLKACTLPRGPTTPGVTTATPLHGTTTSARVLAPLAHVAQRWSLLCSSACRSVSIPTWRTAAQHAAGRRSGGVWTQVLQAYGRCSCVHSPWVGHKICHGGT